MWAIAAFVPAIVSLILMPIVIYLLYKPEITSTPNAPHFAKERLAQLGPISLPEKITLAVFALLLIMWAGVPALLFGDGFSINATTAAFIGLSILLCTGVLNWDDILKNKGAWDTVVWFSALVMMASFLGKLGLIKWLSLSVGASIDSMGISWVSGMILLVLIYVYSHYFFASTTAHITAMFAAFLCCRFSPWCTTNVIRADFGILIFINDVINTLWYRYGAHYFWFRLCHIR